MAVTRSDSACSGLNYSDNSDEDADNHKTVDNLWNILDKINTVRGRMSRQNFGAIEYHGDDAEENTSLPPTYIIIKIASDIPDKTVVWLVEKIRAKRRDGGAELMVFRQPFNPEEGFVLHISASKIKFLEAAEEMEIVKEDRNGQMREFTVDQLEEFLPEGGHVEDLLTIAERQTIVLHELENIRALTEDMHVPGLPTCALYEGQSILQVCLQFNIVTKVYPLHDKEALKKLGRKWYMSLFEKQPIEEIRLYFGEAIALYFTFLGFYTKALLFPVLLGILQLVIPTETVSFFCIFNVVWVTVFLEVWRRKSNELAFKWGTIGMTSLDEPRPNFRGVMGVDAVTGRMQPQYPRWKTNIKMYCVSIPAVFFCMSGAFMVMLLSFWLEEHIKTYEFSWPHIKQLPSIVYSILVYVMNVYYRKLATALTEWENHRTQSQFDRHRVTKLVLFEFVNNFVSMFYIAFIYRDMDMLRSQLATMLIILQAINHIQEAILPLLIRFYTNKMAEMKRYLRRKSSSTADFAKMKKQWSFDDYNGKSTCLDYIPQIHPEDTRLEEAAREGEMEVYEETYDDYLEMFIQFGYVVLFSSVYPAAAIWAVFNNILEIRADAFKLCVIYQRPKRKRVKDIGAWQRTFEIVGAMSIMTNCGLLCLNPHLRQHAPDDMGEIEWVLLFVLLEHVLIGVRYLLHIAIPEKPEWVRVALAKKNYESRQALKFERAQRNRRLLTRRFKTIHGARSLNLN